MSNPSDFIIENGVLIKYVGPGGGVVVPEGTAEIGPDAFYRCSSLTSIFLPEGVTIIGAGAFCDCAQLQQIRLPESLKEIDADAFRGTDLREIVIPAGVKRIGDEAFAFLGAWQVIDGQLWSNEDGSSTQRRVSISGAPKIGKTVFENHYAVSDYCKNRINLRFELPEKTPQFPLVLSWKDLVGADIAGIHAGKGEVIWDLLHNPDKYRAADQQYLADCARKSRKTLYPALLKQIDVPGFERFLALGLVDAGNSDQVLDLIQNRAELRTILMTYISNHISQDSRQAAEEKKIDQVIERQIKKIKAVAEAISSFEKKKPADVKKEWGVTETDGSLRIDQYKGKDVGIVVPSKIGKKEVREIADDAFRASADDEGRKNAYQKKMYKNKCIVLQEGIAKIGARAFMGCVYLTDCVLPGTVSEIGVEAFKGCHKLTIHAPAGSYAEQYANENNIPFEVE